MRSVRSSADRDRFNSFGINPPEYHFSNAYELRAFVHYVLHESKGPDGRLLRKEGLLRRARKRIDDYLENCFPPIS